MQQIKEHETAIRILEYLLAERFRHPMFESMDDAARAVEAYAFLTTQLSQLKSRLTQLKAEQAPKEA